MTSRFDDLLKRYKTDGYSQWDKTHEAQVLEPYTYLFENPGKDIRSILIHAFNQWLKVPPELLITVLKAVEMLHTASLLIDDVEDGSELRRGCVAAHLKFGPASTINAANYVYFSAMSLIRSTGNSDVIQTFEEEILNLHRGQGLELYWRDQVTSCVPNYCPSEQDYIDMVNNKTGGLLRMAIRLLQALGSKTAQDNNISHHRDVPTNDTPCKDYVPLANLVGILFQIRDDYMNLASTQYCREKGFCEDLTEGKFSFPVIHGIQSSPFSGRLLEILLSKTTDVCTKIEACELLVSSGSLQYTITAVADLDRLCRAEILHLGGNSALIKILDMLLIKGDGSEIADTIEFAKQGLVGHSNASQNLRL